MAGQAGPHLDDAGSITFAVSIGAAFTGYLSQQNFDSQWISTQAKDGLNSVGIGAFFNVLNFGQMLLWHVLLLPVAVGVLIGRPSAPGASPWRGAALAGARRSPLGPPRVEAPTSTSPSAGADQ